MLGHEHAPPAMWPSADRRPMQRECGRRPGDAKRHGMAQRASVPGRFQAQGVGIGESVAAIQVEGDRVEHAPVMRGATAPDTSCRRKPMRQLVEQGQAMVQRIGTGADGDHAVRTARNAG